MKDHYFYEICMFFSSMVEIYIVLDFFDAFHKRHDRFHGIVSKIVIWFIFVVINFFINLQNSSVINIIGISISYFCMIIILYKGNFWMKIIHWITVILVGFGLEFIFITIFSISAKVGIESNFKTPFFMASVLFASKLLYFIIMSVIRHISKMASEQLEFNVFCHYILVPVLSLLIMILIPYIRKDEAVITVFDVALTIIYMALILTNIRLFYLLTWYSKMKEQQKYREVVESRYGERREQIKQMDNRLKGFLHDMKYYLRMIGIYAENGEVDKIKNAIKELEIRTDTEQKERICANDFLNTILNDYLIKGIYQKVPVEFFVEQGFQIDYIKEIDQISILGNILDNAIEAAKKCDGSVAMRCFMQNNGYFSVIHIENNYNGQLLDLGYAYATTKKDKGIHGYGMSNVKELVSKYEGIIQEEHDEKCFHTTIVIPAVSDTKY